jgi:hypothetical protein
MGVSVQSDSPEFIGGRGAAAAAGGAMRWSDDRATWLARLLRNARQCACATPLARLDGQHRVGVISKEARQRREVSPQHCQPLPIRSMIGASTIVINHDTRYRRLLKNQETRRETRL